MGLGSPLRETGPRLVLSVPDELGCDSEVAPYYVIPVYYKLGLSPSYPVSWYVATLYSESKYCRPLSYIRVRSMEL